MERNYRCASNEMAVFNAIGYGASSVVRKAIHIPTHRILALKKINVFEKVRFVPAHALHCDDRMGRGGGRVAGEGLGGEGVYVASCYLTGNNAYSGNSHIIC